MNVAVATLILEYCDCNIMSIDSVCVLYCILFPFVNARTGWVDQGWKEPVHKASSH